MTDRGTPDGVEAGLEEMRTSVLSDWMDTCSLAFVPEGRSVVVTTVAAADAALRLARVGIEKGVTLEAVRHVGDHVVVRLPSGGEAMLARRDAWVVQVTPPLCIAETRRGLSDPPSSRVRRRRRAQSRRYHR